MSPAHLCSKPSYYLRFPLISFPTVSKSVLTGDEAPAPTASHSHN